MVWCERCAGVSSLCEDAVILNGRLTVDGEAGFEYVRRSIDPGDLEAGIRGFRVEKLMIQVIRQGDDLKKATLRINWGMMELARRSSSSRESRLRRYGPERYGPERYRRTVCPS
jgi:hypothetical protein